MQFVKINMVHVRNKIDMVHERHKFNKSKYTIKEIQTGENPDLLLIVINTSNSKYQIITWDMISNSSTSFTDDISGDYQILWDNQGSPTILTQGTVIFTTQGCRTKVFNNLPSPPDPESNLRKWAQGH